VMTLQENSRCESSSSSQPAPLSLSQSDEKDSWATTPRWPNGEVAVLVEDVAASLNATKRSRGQTGARDSACFRVPTPTMPSLLTKIMLVLGSIQTPDSSLPRSTGPSSPTAADVRFPATQMVKHEA
jgi:hypothetical protein